MSTAAATGGRTSLWLAHDGGPGPRPAALPARADVVVLGGGIAGVTAAHRCAGAGASVLLIERGRIAGVTTGRTTAKVTAGHGRRYAAMRDHDPDLARAYAESQRWAVEETARTAMAQGIDCDLVETDHWVYSVSGLEWNDMRAEGAAAAGLGLPAAFEGETPLPFSTAGGAVRYRGQYRFDPVRYVRGLAAAARDAGAVIAEEVQADGITDAASAGWRVRTPLGTVTGRSVIVATHVPFLARGALWGRVGMRMAHVLAAPPAEGEWHLDEATYVSTETPDHSLRIARGDGEQLLVVSGESHETGARVDRAALEARLERWMRARYAVGEIRHRWAVQDAYSLDGVPHIGPLEHGLFAATGFGGWGMSNGTLAGALMADAALGRPNEWARWYAPRLLRGGPGGTAAVAAHNAKLGLRILADRIRSPQDAPDAAVRGHAAPVAERRRPDGTVMRVSAVCTHLGCVVRWNDADETWDCPCHGSRFADDGTVLEGPALRPLAPADGP
ncbi:MAG: FAD-dependent oxidoreductase [Thermoleophilia bacterium]